MANLAASLLTPVTPVAPTSAPALVASDGRDAFGEMLAKAMSRPDQAAGDDAAAAFAELSPAGALPQISIDAPEVPASSLAAQVAGQLQPVAVTAEGAALSVSQLPVIPAVAKAVAGLMADGEGAAQMSEAAGEPVASASPVTPAPRPISRDQLEQALAHYGLVSPAPPTVTMDAPLEILPVPTAPTAQSIDRSPVAGDGALAELALDDPVLTDAAGLPQAPTGPMPFVVAQAIPPVMLPVGSPGEAGPLEEAVAVDAPAGVSAAPASPRLPQAQPPLAHLTEAALPAPLANEFGVGPAVSDDLAAAPAIAARPPVGPLEVAPFAAVAGPALPPGGDAETNAQALPPAAAPMAPVDTGPAAVDDAVRPLIAAAPLPDAGSGVEAAAQVAARPQAPAAALLPEAGPGVEAVPQASGSPLAPPAGVAASEAKAATPSLSSANPAPAPAATGSGDLSAASLPSAPAVQPALTEQKPASAGPVPKIAEASASKAAAATPAPTLIVTSAPDPLTVSRTLPVAAAPALDAGVATPASTAPQPIGIPEAAKPATPVTAVPSEGPVKAMPADEVAIRFGQMLGTEPRQAAAPAQTEATETPSAATPAERPAAPVVAVTSPAGLQGLQVAAQVVQAASANPAALLSPVPAAVPAESAGATSTAASQAQPTVAAASTPAQPEIASVIQSVAPVKSPRRSGDPASVTPVAASSPDETAPATGGSAKPVATSTPDSATADLGAQSDDATVTPQPAAPQRAEARPLAHALASHSHPAHAAQPNAQPAGEGVTAVVAKVAEGVTAAAQRFVERLRGDSASPKDDLSSMTQATVLPASQQTTQLIQPAVHRETQAMAQQPPVPLQQVAQEIVRQADKGMTSFEIRLNPVELGGMDVRLDFSDTGEAKAHIAVERRDTLELLTRDQRQIEKTLRDAGYEARDGSVSLSLKQGNTGDRQPAPDRSAEMWRENRTASNDTAETERASTPRIEAYRPRRDAVLDVRI